MSLKEQLAEHCAGWYQHVPAERQAIMARHIGTIAKTVLRIGDLRHRSRWPDRLCVHGRRLPRPRRPRDVLAVQTKGAAAA